jgi:hypothetical protein
MKRLRRPFRRHDHIRNLLFSGPILHIYLPPPCQRLIHMPIRSHRRLRLHHHQLHKRGQIRHIEHPYRRSYPLSDRSAQTQGQPSTLITYQLRNDRSALEKSLLCLVSRKEWLYIRRRGTIGRMPTMGWKSGWIGQDQDQNFECSHLPRSS